MRQHFLQGKLATTWWLVALLLVAFFVVTFGIRGVNLRGRLDQLTVEKLPNQAVTAKFFRETDVGRKLLAHLSCIDFDCRKKLQDLVALGSKAVTPLIRVLEDGIPREVAAQLSGDVPRLVRIRAVNALGELRDERAISPLLSLLSDPYPGTRANVAAALGKFGGDESFLALLRLLRDSDFGVRESAASALARLRRMDAIPALRSAAQAERVTHVRQAMEAAISKIQQR